MSKIEDDFYEKALGKVLNFLSYSARSEREVSDRIEKVFSSREVPENEKSKIKADIIEQLRSLNLINDRMYAENYIKGRVRAGKPISQRKIYEYLYKKGISKETIEEVSSYYTYELEHTFVLELAEKKLKTLKDKEAFTRKKKLTAYLLGKGFSPQIVYAVVDTKFKVQ
jgi:regulatory protein